MQEQHIRLDPLLLSVRGAVRHRFQSFLALRLQRDHAADDLSSRRTAIIRRQPLAR